MKIVEMADKRYGGWERDWPKQKLVFLLEGLEVFLLPSINIGQEGKGGYIFREEVSSIVTGGDSEECGEAQRYYLKIMEFLYMIIKKNKKIRDRARGYSFVK